eukprot:superscaffoldBa00000107_g1564
MLVSKWSRSRKECSSKTWEEGGEWIFSIGVAKRGASVLGRWSSDGRQCWLWLGLGMLNGGREGLFELGQQLQQQGEYQAALHCFLSCLLGLTHVQSFTSLPNCLHQMVYLILTLFPRDSQELRKVQYNACLTIL